MQGIGKKVKRGIPLFQITLNRLIHDKKTKFIMFLSLLPLLMVSIIIIYRHSYLNSKTELADAFTGLVAGLYFNIFLILFALIEATALINEEKKNKTMSFLLVRPISRYDLVIYKYLAFLVLSFFVVAIPLTFLYCFMASAVSFSAFITHLDLLFSAIFIGFLVCAVYGIMFLWCGVHFDRPLYIALLLGFGLNFLGTIGIMGPTLGKAVPMYHFYGFMFELMRHDFVRDMTGLMDVWKSCVYLTFFSFFFLVLALMKIKTKDFP